MRIINEKFEKIRKRKTFDLGASKIQFDLIRVDSCPFEPLKQIEI